MLDLKSDSDSSFVERMDTQNTQAFALKGILKLMINSKYHFKSKRIKFLRGTSGRDELSKQCECAY
ncbi:hypothetical protein BpHYR1_024280 [Brachionus plicatilis]|uniref:Uncharacterized protein n=1 Tax=Brachionus plicatilis TaxID=10195 RepID=A0A3M7SFA6_BRAPC|nr:hypothetical protein BpHYR1_024280 [Brachionus plicatilis]